MTATPRFALANLSNTKNPAFSSNIFKNLHSNIEKNTGISHFFEENITDFKIEKKFGDSYEIKEVFFI